MLALQLNHMKMKKTAEAVFFGKSR